MSFDHFPRGFRLDARIFDLQKAGVSILTVKEALDNEGMRAMYMLR